MSGLRGLLRLDDKVAAEGRRLHQLGGRPLRGLTPLTLLAAAGVHAALLLLPAVTTKATYPAVSAVPAFPVVWRPPAARDPDPLPQSPAIASGGSRSASPAAVTPGPLVYIAGGTTSAPPIINPAILEPIAEPDSESLLRISAEVEALIPDPDPPPPVDVGPPLGVSPGPVEASPALLQKVNPAYPAVARNLNAEGHVTLRVSVEPDGSVGSAAVEECSRPGVGFESAALASVKKWRYAPAPGQPVRSVVVTIHFKQPQAQP